MENNIVPIGIAGIDHVSLDGPDPYGNGPWQGEPDFQMWLSGDVPCLVRRCPDMGHLCGYVAVHEEHPWFQKHHSELCVDVHGCLTNSAACNPGNATGEPRQWWHVGFDCGHIERGDLIPLFVRLGMMSPNGVYRDLAYVTAEVEKLAAFARAAR